MPPAWRDQLIEEQIRGYGLPTPAVAPAVWPQAGGRGVLLTDPGRPHLSNAGTVRFMAPGLSPLLPGGYMLYTDEAGGYIDPHTGASHFAQQLENGETHELRPRYDDARSAKPSQWTWPQDAVREVDIDEAAEYFVDRPVVGITSGHLGWRLVLDRGDRPEPRIYVDVFEPEHRDRHGDEIDARVGESAIVRKPITDLTAHGGTLKLTLSDGSTIRSAAHENYESWQLVAADRGLWVFLPGGELAAFRFDRAAGSESRA